MAMPAAVPASMPPLLLLLLFPRFCATALADVAKANAIATQMLIARFIELPPELAPVASSDATSKKLDPRAERSILHQNRKSTS
jgi:hypothetical protein